MIYAHPRSTLLAEDEPGPVQLLRETGSSPFFLTCDHAGRRIPRSLGQLGLSPADLRRHIAWDIGAAALTIQLSALLQATAVLQRYSRLVIDCNRPLRSADSIASLSEQTLIPGNQNLGHDASTQRTREVFEPYHACLRAQLDARTQRGQPTLLIAMHSFTPVYLGQSRPWHVGVLYHRDARLALALRNALRNEPDLVVGDNQPYSVSDETDYGVPEYGERRGLPHVELEIRQDLLEKPAGQREWAQRLARLMRPLAEAFV